MNTEIAGENWIEVSVNKLKKNKSVSGYGSQGEGSSLCFVFF